MHLGISPTWKLSPKVVCELMIHAKANDPWKCHVKFKILVEKLIRWPIFQQLGGDVVVNSNMTAVNQNQPTFQADHAIWDQYIGQTATWLKSRHYLVYPWWKWNIILFSPITFSDTSGSFFFNKTKEIMLMSAKLQQRPRWTVIFDYAA